MSQDRGTFERLVTRSPISPAVGGSASSPNCDETENSTSDSLFMPPANTLVRWVNENAFAPIVRARPDLWAEGGRQYGPVKAANDQSSLMAFASVPSRMTKRPVLVRTETGRFFCFQARARA